MSETTDTQAPQTSSSAPSAWKKIVDGQVKRVESASAEAERLSALSIDTARTAIDETAKLTRESFTFFAELSSEWRKLTLDATRRTAELLTPRG